MKATILQLHDKCPACGHKFLHLIEVVAEIPILSEYKLFQKLKSKLYGFKKERSYRQLQTYWCAVKTVVDNLEGISKESVDFNCRVALDFRDPTKVAVRPDGAVQFSYRSISFANLGHMEACDYFNRAWPVLAKMIGITVEELLANAKS
jgi:hypothetical protein